MVSREVSLTNSKVKTDIKKWVVQSIVAQKLGRGEFNGLESKDRYLKKVYSCAEGGK